MYPAHFAAGLAVKGSVPRAPAWALLTAAFVPDFIWILLSRAGIEPELPPRGFFDDWSHSLVMIVLWATVFAFVFWRRGRLVVFAVWIAGLSHVPLDFLIHPKQLGLFPHSRIRLGWELWEWGQRKSRYGPSYYWWIEAAAIVVLLAWYAWFSRKSSIRPALVTASCLLVAGLHLLSL